MKFFKTQYWFGKKNTDQITQEQLQRKGFDPSQLDTENFPQNQLITQLSSDYKGFLKQLNQQQIQSLLKKFKYFPIQTFQRHQFAHPKGGKICADQKQINKIRSIAKQVIKQIGRKLLSGQNLTRISFPIKAMFPKSTLQSSLITTFLFPLYVRKAAQIQDHYQRFKLVCTSLLQYSYFSNLFLKPVNNFNQLNPILGQTLQAKYPDGTLLYLQQIKHHPPISYFYVIGPQNKYKFWGYYHFEASASLNSLTLINKGKRFIQFYDGQIIQSNFPRTIYCGVFIGTLRQQQGGNVLIYDKTNQYKLQIKYGQLKKQPSDCFQSVITQKGIVKSKVKGTPLGYLDIDDIRYFDGRYVCPLKVKKINSQQQYKVYQNLTFQEEQTQKLYIREILIWPKYKNRNYNKFKEMIRNQGQNLGNNINDFIIYSFTHPSNQILSIQQKQTLYILYHKKKQNDNQENTIQLQLTLIF